MMLLRLFRPLSALLSALLLAGCATTPAPWDDAIDVTQMLRLSPDSFRVVSVIPRGLGERGEALFVWLILKTDGSVEFSEEFVMPRVGEPRSNDQGRLEATYRLRAADQARFQTQQIRQRAQLLAGYYLIGVNVVPSLCDHAGISAGSEVVYSVLMDAAAEAKITTVRVEGTAAALQSQIPYCV